ncbi:MAG: PaaI family thioesterase [Myxococcota bacterium]|mgnify:CR=1 FL=1
MPKAITSKDCYACGRDNVHGLRMRMIPDGDAVRCRFVPPPHARGFSRVAHGGIHAALLDEAIGVAVALRLGIKSVTASLSVTYRLPMIIGKPVVVRAWLDRRGRRFAYGAGDIRDARGRVIAEARARLVGLRERHTQTFVGRAIERK